MASSGHQEYPEGSGNLPELPWEKKPRKWESMRMRSSRQQSITPQVIASFVALLQLHVAYQQRLSATASYREPYTHCSQQNLCIFVELRMARHLLQFHQRLEVCPGRSERRSDAQCGQPPARLGP
jgi:hypothetical protein